MSDRAETLVRLATERDRDVLRDFLGRAAAGDNIEKFDMLGTLQEFVLPLAQVRAGQLFIALRVWTMVGLASVVFRHDGDIELDALLVDPDGDRDGALGALLLAGLAFARTAGAKALCATVTPSAQPLLARWGFAAAGASPDAEAVVQLKAPVQKGG